MVVERGDPAAIVGADKLWLANFGRDTRMTGPPSSGLYRRRSVPTRSPLRGRKRSHGRAGGGAPRPTNGGETDAVEHGGHHGAYRENKIGRAQQKK